MRRNWFCTIPTHRQTNEPDYSRLALSAIDNDNNDDIRIDGLCLRW